MSSTSNRFYEHYFIYRHETASDGEGLVLEIFITITPRFTLIQCGSTC